MTVSTAYAPLSYSGNGSATAFSVTWPFYTGTLQVTLVDEDGVETVKTISTHYTVAGGTDGNGLPATGTVTMLSAPANDETLRIERVTAKTQSSTWTNGGGFQAKTLESALDKLLLISQETAAAASGLLDGMDGDLMRLETSGATDYWDGENHIIRNVADGTEDDDAVTKSQMESALSAATIGDTGFVQAGTGAVERTWQGKMRDDISALDFGAVGDGSTNNRAFLQSAIAAAAGARLHIPAGTYRVLLNSAVAFTPAANTSIIGDGRDCTELVLVAPSTSFCAGFSIQNGGFHIDGVKITLEVPSTGSMAVFNWSSSILRIINCDLSGATTNSGATVSHDSFAINTSATGTFTTLLVENNLIHNFTYPLLKSNVATSVQSGIRFLNNDFYTNYYEDLGFNSPLGSMTDVLASGNTFGSPAGSGASLSQLYLTFASISNFRAANNRFSGVVAEAIHIEENCTYGVVSGNTIDVDGNGLRVLDNNISGTVYIPSNIQVFGNTIKKAGTQKSANSYGINVVFDGSAQVPAQKCSFHGNVIEGFYYGISYGSTVDDGCTFTQNTIINCTAGIAGFTALSGFADNHFMTCTAAIYAEAGGTVESPTFLSNTTNVDAVNVPVSVSDPVFLFPEFNVSAGTNTYKDCINLGVNDRASGTFYIVAKCDTAADNAAHAVEIDWDGSVLRRNTRLDYTPGGVALLGQRNSSLLSVNLYSTSARNNFVVQCRFAGVVLVGVTFTTVTGTSEGSLDLVEDASTNTVVPLKTYLRRSSGTPANGIGVSVQLAVETATGNDEIGATIEAVTTDVTAASEDFDLVLKTMAAGAAAAERARFSGGNGANLKLPAGSSTQASLNLASSTIKTTAAAGDVCYDGKAFYAAHAASAHGVIPAVQFAMLAADRAGSNSSTAQAIFDAANDTFTVEASTTYRFEGVIMIARFAGTTSHDTSLLFGGTATLTSIAYLASTTQTTGAPTEAAAAKQRNILTAAATVVGATSTDASEYLTIRVGGVVRVNGAGTIVPQFKYSAAPGDVPYIQNNSYFEIWPVGTNAVTKVGNVG